MISPSQVHYLAQEQHKELERQARHYHEVKIATSAAPERLSEFKTWIGKQMVAMGEQLQARSLQTCSADCTQPDACAVC